jgi:hypothetical protein
MVERVTPTPDAAAQELANATAANGGVAPAQAAPGVAVEAPAPEAGTRPEGLPEGYDSYEAFSKAVLDGTYKPAAAPVAEPVVDDGNAPAADDPRLVPYTEEFTTNGNLSDESIDKAAKEFGVSPEMVRIYVAGLAGSADAAANDITSVAGGAEGYAQFSEWAAGGGMTPEQQALYNKALDGDPKVAKALLETHVANWKAAGFGPAPVDVTQGIPPEGQQTAGAGYESWAQVQMDMADPRYSGNGGTRDPAFIKGVEEKLARSPALD